MINPLQTSVPQADGSGRYVIIEPVLEKEGGRGLRPTGVFKIYKDAFTNHKFISIFPKF